MSFVINFEFVRSVDEFKMAEPKQHEIIGFDAGSATQKAAPFERAGRSLYGGLVRMVQRAR